MFHVRFRSIPAAALVVGIALLSASMLGAQQAPSEPETIMVNAKAAGTPFPHYWDEMFGSGHANLVMRRSYLRDMAAVKKVTDFKYVRFHGILDDENGVYSVNAKGQPVYNWTYVDHIYDDLLSEGVMPYVEISFMPKALASNPNATQGFWYHPNPSPPKSWAKWDALITAFAKHLVKRYGINEVSRWYFEVWNEPNLDFWTGKPAQATYFELYDHTARALKAVSPRIRVGGPATAQAAWVGDMIAHATKDHVPLDFVSTHIYGNDSAENVFHDNRDIAPHQMVCAAMSKVDAEIKRSARPHIPLILSEFNASYMNQQDIEDSIYMGPWLADTISKCAGRVTMMSYWTFSDVFEEQGVEKTPFYGGFGLIAQGGIPKPSFDAFALLHELGTTRLPAPKNEAIVTRRKDGTLVIAAWNLVEPSTKNALSKTVTFDFSGIPSGAHASIRRVDAKHGDTLAAWKRMGSPKYPTQTQIAELKKASETGPAQVVAIHDDRLTLTLPPMGLAVMEIK